MAKKNIMIVDDSPSLRKALNVTLSEAGYQVIEVCDDREARSLLDALSLLDGMYVHLVICNLALPNMDGMAFLRELRQRSDYLFTPVIALSTDNWAEKKEEGREIGIKSWLVKPFQPEQILAAVSKLVLS